MIALKKISKYYGDTQVVQNIKLEVKKGEALVLLGPSGCGKTTTLKMINRLVELDEGHILINNKDIRDVNPIELRRSIGYVIQNVGLFPHMSIAGNIGIVPKLKGWPDKRIKQKTGEILKTVKLPKTVLSRYPHELSGGQKQRIGVARAIIGEPDIILMDEPFGALDPITREGLQDEFNDLLKQIKLTVVFVTHDIFEAFRIADRIALMNHGKLVQVDTPKNIAKKPANAFVKKFIGKHVNALLSEIKK